MSNVDDVTVVIKTFIRPRQVKRLIKSIREHYPDIKIIVVNDGDDENVYEDENMKTILLPFDTGLSAGRNAGVAEVETEYFVLCDDDFIFTDETDVARWKDLLIKYDFDILGSRIQATEYSSGNWTWLWDDKRGDGRIYEKHGYHSSWQDNGFTVAHVDFCLNTFIARTKVIQEHPWDEKYKIMEHRPFFYKYRNALRVGWSEEIFMGHEHGKQSKRYLDMRRDPARKKYFQKFHRQDGYYFNYCSNMSSTKKKTVGPNKLRSGQKLLPKPIHNSVEHKKNGNLKIMVVGRNNGWNIPDLIHSLNSQTYKDFEVVLADDNSSDGMADLWYDLTKNDSRFDQFYNETQYWSLGNQIKAIDYMSTDDQDIIIKIDADDMLYNDRALEIVRRKYDVEGAWMTYGNAYRPSLKRNIVAPWSPRTVRKNSFRKDGWRSLHLSTYKRWLWDRINHDASLTDVDGEYYKVTEDQARGYPMYEMAGTRAKYIYDVLYYYNDTLETNDFNANWAEQQRVSKRIRRMQPAKRLPPDFEV